MRATIRNKERGEQRGRVMERGGGQKKSETDIEAEMSTAMGGQEVRRGNEMEKRKEREKQAEGRRSSLYL